MWPVSLIKYKKKLGGPFQIERNNKNWQSSPRFLDCCTSQFASFNIKGFRRQRHKWQILYFIFKFNLVVFQDVDRRCPTGSDVALGLRGMERTNTNHVLHRCPGLYPVFVTLLEGSVKGTCERNYYTVSTARSMLRAYLATCLKLPIVSLPLDICDLMAVYRR